MTVRTLGGDREIEINLGDAARTAAGAAMVVAFAGIFLLVLSQIFAVIA